LAGTTVTGGRIHAARRCIPGRGARLARELTRRHLRAVFHTGGFQADHPHPIPGNFKLAFSSADGRTIAHRLMLRLGR
jgi:hypothetical protein